MELLKIQGLKMNYGAVAALKGIDLTVSEGQIVALLGANGAGKTTTLKAVSGLLKPTGGEILFEGENIAGRNAHQIARRGIMQSPEGRHVLLGLSVEENLRAGAHTVAQQHIIAAVRTGKGKAPVTVGLLLLPGTGSQFDPEFHLRIFCLPG